MCVTVCVFPLCSYFLGELEKCLAEPERLAQLFIKHVSTMYTHTHTCSPRSSQVSGPSSLWSLEFEGAKSCRNKTNQKSPAELLLIFYRTAFRLSELPTFPSSSLLLIRLSQPVFLQQCTWITHTYTHDMLSSLAVWTGGPVRKHQGKTGWKENKNKRKK